MSSVSTQEIVSAHSPDSDDAFMFYGLATKKVRSSKVTFRHVLSDIETLNRKAMEGVYDLSAISYHAYPVRCRQIRSDGQRLEHRRWLRSDDRRQPSDGAGRDQGKEHRDSRHDDHGVSGLQTVSAGFRARGDAVRQNPRRRTRARRGWRSDHSRSAADVRPRRLPSRRRHGPVVEEHLRPAAAAGRQRPAALARSRRSRANAAA